MQLDRCLAVTILSKQPSSDQKHPNLTVNLSKLPLPRMHFITYANMAVTGYVTMPRCIWHLPASQTSPSNGNACYQSPGVSELRLTT